MSVAYSSRDDLSRDALQQAVAKNRPMNSRIQIHCLPLPSHREKTFSAEIALGLRIYKHLFLVLVVHLASCLFFTENMLSLLNASAVFWLQQHLCRASDSRNQTHLIDVTIFVLLYPVFTAWPQVTLN